jgi:hypothetical protein
VVAAAARWRGARLDLAAIVVLWLPFAWWAAHGGRAVGYDTIRDMAYAQGILQGRLWEDPSILGLPAWYPPGSALAFAGLAFVTRIPVTSLYATSLYWLGWLNPVALYLLVRACWGRGAALAALPLVLLGSFWWLTHAVMPMPSVQGVALGLLTLLAWTRWAGRGPTGAAATGVLGGLAFWHHPICGAVALGAIVLHGALAPWLAERRAGEAGRFGLALDAAVTAGISAALAAPLVVRQWRLPRINTAPQEWFGPELHDPRFALHGHAPLVVPLGLIGLAWAARRWRTSGWLVGCFVVALAGEIAGYLGHDQGWRIPWALPHEFQWHEQLALMMAAALAVVRIPEWLAPRLPRGAGSLVRRAGGVALLGLAVGPALPSLQVSDSFLVHLDRRWDATFAAAEWVRAHTPARSVFVCAPEVGYSMSGLTGRKCIALPPGHMNPAADLAARYADLTEMLTTHDEAVFARLARGYHADYFLPLLAPREAAAARVTYAGWRCLEPTSLPDSVALIYRIRPALAPRP